MKRADLIPSVLFGAILTSIYMTSPEIENLELPGTALPQVVEFSGSASSTSGTEFQSVSPATKRGNAFTPYSHDADGYDVEPIPDTSFDVVFSYHAG